MTRSRTERTRFGGYPLLHIGPKTSGTDYGPTSRLMTATCVDSVHPGPPYLAGGGLDIAKKQFAQSPSIKCYYSNGATGAQFYSGKFYLEPPLPLTAIPASIDLSGWGAKGYSRGLPVHDELNLAQFVGELKDFPQMIKSTKNFFSQFGSSAWSGKSAQFWSEGYLNYQFGWKPFVDDLKKMLNFEKRLGDRANWLRNHNGQKIKRSFTLAEGSTNVQVTSLDSNFGALQPGLPTQYYPVISGMQPSGGRLVTRQSDEYRIWFSGSFTFHIPKNEMPSGALSPKLRNELMGAFPDLSVVYKLTPWSWLLDWFSSTGAALSNFMLMAKYHQLATSAYVMRSTRTTIRSEAHQYVLVGNHLKPTVRLVSASATTTVTRKQRSVANPYGFGATWDGLNPYQLSILAALGITRGQGGL